LIGGPLRWASQAGAGFRVVWGWRVTFVGVFIGRGSRGERLGRQVETRLGASERELPLHSLSSHGRSMRVDQAGLMVHVLPYVEKNRREEKKRETDTLAGKRIRKRKERRKPGKSHLAQTNLWCTPGVAFSFLRSRSGVPRAGRAPAAVPGRGLQGTCKVIQERAPFRARFPWFSRKV
jgi:hypothetical protein